LGVSRKAEKIDVYTDRRKLEDQDKIEDTMDKWDDAKLAKVVEEKHGDEKHNDEKDQPQTEIVCKYFLDAIEKHQYGWFWICPNGGDECKYKHALPPGYSLKKEKKEEEEEENIIPIEEAIEEERRKVVGLTPVTLESFLEWKKRKKQKKEAEILEAERKKSEDIKAGKKIMSGRDLFTYNPDLFVDDEEGAMETQEYAEQVEDNEIELVITETSVIRHVHEKTEGEDENTNDSDGEQGKNEENISGDEQSDNESDDDKDVPVDESLFLEDEDIPEEK